MRHKFKKIVSTRFYKPKSKADWLVAVLLLLIVADSVINAMNYGDFIGYLNVGYKVLYGKNIYFGKLITWGYYNTWPPFFSVTAVPLAVLDSVSPYLTRLLWLLGSWASIFVIMKLTVRLLFNKRLLWPLQKKVTNQDLLFGSSMVVIPFLLIFRLLLDNSSHLQINMYMMLMAMLSVYFFYKEKPVLAGLVLGFSIAIKVYTVFFLIYFLYKRAYHVCIATVTFILLFLLSTFLVFGEINMYYHLYWFKANVLAMPPTNHMNQSLLVMLYRWLSDVDTGMNFRGNFLSLSADLVKKFFYVMVVLFSLVPIYLFRKPLDKKMISIGQALEWGILFSVIPLLTPVAWKYYFIFLWLPIFIFYYLVFEKKMLANSKSEKTTKWLFYLSMIALILSSELFMGVWFSDILEVFGIITIGGVLMLVALFKVYFGMPKQMRESPIT